MSMRSKFRPTGKPRDTHEAVARLQREVATAFDALYVDLNAVQAAGAACCEANEEAIDDLTAEGGDAVPSTRTLTAGAGLTGGGDLSADRTFNVGAGTGITVNADSIEVDASAVDHGSLAGLADQADHTWALTVDGTRALTGNWDAGSFNITAQSLTADTGNVTATAGVVVATAVTYTGTDGTNGQVLATNGSGTTSFRRIRCQEKLAIPDSVSGAVRTVTGTSTSFAFRNSNNDYVVYQWRIPDDIDTAFGVEIHMMWAPASAGGGNIVTEVYCERNDDGTYDIDAVDSFTATSYTAQVHTLSATQGVVTYAENFINFVGGVFPVNSDGAVAGEFIRIQVRRAGSHASDTFTGTGWMRQDVYLVYRKLVPA